MSLLAFSILVSTLAVLVAFVISFFVVAVDLQGEPIVDDYFPTNLANKQKAFDRFSIESNQTTPSFMDLVSVANNLESPEEDENYDPMEPEMQSLELERLLIEPTDSMVAQEMSDEELQQMLQKKETKPKEEFGSEESTKTPSEEADFTLRLDPSAEIGEIHRIFEVFSLVPHPEKANTWLAEDKETQVRLKQSKEEGYLLLLDGPRAKELSETFAYDLPIL